MAQRLYNATAVGAGSGLFFIGTKVGGHLFPDKGEIKRKQLFFTRRPGARGRPGGLGKGDRGACCQLWSAFNVFGICFNWWRVKRSLLVTATSDGHGDHGKR